MVLSILDATFPLENGCDCQWEVLIQRAQSNPLEPPHIWHYSSGSGSAATVAITIPVVQATLLPVLPQGRL